ncbi:chromate efflux transporter [Mesorhizobium xinjiangense]|uniref:chromate efflux transporter n=1 Tax=Mesorhizobium xinjiangense TaxID=2678685 RepID=UPI0012ED1DC1|nr:chromate efflux transporter [Mesorhizobium xinjiangense]
MTREAVNGRNVPGLAEATAAFARIGLLSFGGPAGQIALMHRILVEEKRWLDEPRFLHALNYCMLLPGPEAMQLATYAGWLLHGVRGGLIAGLLFVLPGAVVIVILSAVYVLVGDVPVVQGLLLGLKAAVLAIVLEALVKVSKRALKGSLAVVLAVAAFVGIALLNIPFPAIILAAALIGVLAHGMSADSGTDQAGGDAIVDAGMPAWARPGLARFMRTSGVWLMVWFVPLAALFAVLGSDHVLAREAAFFSKMAAVTFGGAYAVLAYVAQQAVEIHGWLAPGEMLTGLGLAETTPGPLILVLVFVGFLGGGRAAGLDPLAGGLAGAAVTLWFTFVPCFLWIFAGAPYVETVRHVRWLAKALSAVTAAVVGVIANLAVWFGIHVLFGRVGTWQYGPFALPAPEPASFDLLAAAIASGAAIALMRYQANLIAVLAVAVAAGMLVRFAA